MRRRHARILDHRDGDHRHLGALVSAFTHHDGQAAPRLRRKSAGRAADGHRRAAHDDAELYARGDDWRNRRHRDRADDVAAIRFRTVLYHLRLYCRRDRRHGLFLGAVVGGLVLGVAEQLAAGYVSSLFSNGLAVVLLLVTLLFRPNGLFAPASRDARTCATNSRSTSASCVSQRARSWSSAVSAVTVLLALPWFVADERPALVAGHHRHSVHRRPRTRRPHGVYGPSQSRPGRVHGGRRLYSRHSSRAIWLAAAGGHPAGIALSLVCALLLSLTTMRLRGVYLALATLAFGLLIDSLPSA